MRKLVTLLAVATLAVSSMAVAETTGGNPNDPLQQIQPTGAEPSAPTTLADADTSAPAAAPSSDTSSDTAAAPVAKKHHKKHHKCKHHCKPHHHHKTKAPTPASEHEMQPEAPAQQ